MADDLDELLRRAMKTLDEGVPSGYFEDLPKRALARLENSMDSTTQRGSEAAAAAPPIEEDSGLHDIRNLARSTKERLSRRTSSPDLSDEQLLASSSAGWKVVALPEPAKMVSLPAVDELPSKDEIRAQERAARKAEKAAKTEKAAKAEKAGKAEKATDVAKVDVKAVPARAAMPRAPSVSRGAIFAAVGVLVAGAAVAAIYLTTRSTERAPTQVAQAQPATTPLGPSVAPIVAPAPAPAPAAPPATEPPQAVATVAAAEPTTTPPVLAPSKASHHAVATKPASSKATKGKEALGKDDPLAQATEAKPAATPASDAKKSGDKSADPSLDDLLREAGADQPKKVAAKPALANKALSGDDFKRAMSNVAARAQACYKGTQGTAQIKMVIAPSGQVSKVAVTGQFAGKPEGQCVTNAVKAATFPPWDGGPQTFAYSYLLAE
jgi:hypothetical protein